VELGNVHWLRSLPEALEQSKVSEKPVLILFQEIPGCATCRNYGGDVLTHPLVVEAIETAFVPLVIHNNKGGHDAEVLKRYNEPTWNNPVVRIVDRAGDDIVTRLNGNYSVLGLVDKMREALIKAQGQAPGYLHLLSGELMAESNGIAQATYSMHCFWTGEALFGRVNGVVKTTAGFQNGKEVVRVGYDPEVVSKDALDKLANNQQCRAESAGNFRTDSTPKYYLSQSKYRGIPMTELQKCKVNSALAEHQSPDEFLSPRQLEILGSATNANYVEVSLKDAWKQIKS
jgi:hypothetical protein